MYIYATRDERTREYKEVTDSKLIAGLETLGTRQDVKVGRIEDLIAHTAQSFGSLWMDPHHPRGGTNEGRFTRVIDVQQVAVQVQMLAAANLDRGVRSLAGEGAGRKVHLGEEAKRRQGHLGEALGGKLRLVDDDLLDVGVGGTGPEGGDRCHC